MAEPVPDDPVVTETPKKETKTSNKKETAKFRKLSSHRTGEDCRCSLHCFDEVRLEEKEDLIGHFNSLDSKDNLAALIRPQPIVRRRPRQDKENAKLREYSFKYFVRIVRDGSMSQLHICQKAFIAFFGIKNRRIQTVKSALTTIGK